ncbi:MAG: tRNA (N6-isopentenyl adenosine(37)-C2)-methylthiotransferase MiaB [Candidatus Latescibacterota bacterium]|nr:tRNA (N6-isopentenyl adenosine(37)-C2)-methylthiotransferase MiaB [Candidatus Latescibacterota bacterium]
MDELKLIEPSHPVAALTVGDDSGAGGKGKVFVETYGCQMNVSDSEVMLGVLQAAGYSAATRVEDADVVLLNTCAIREHAEDRVMGRLSQLSQLKVSRPEMILGVCGCMAKHLSEKLLDRVPYVDLVLGPDSYRELPQLVQDAVGEPALDVKLGRSETYVGLDPIRHEGVNAWITVMRGCDKFCTFCIVPYVRGRERSVSAAEVIRQVEIAAQEGFQEVTLLGQTVNSYNDGTTDFADLLKRVALVDDIRRIRFTSPHPSDFSEKLIQTMASEEKICPFIHLPLQSGSDTVLGAMERSYTSGEFLTLVGQLRTAIPGVALSTDIIVGFPGESRKDFQKTLDTMRQVRFDSAFMFKYSEREGTVAGREIPETVSEDEKGERLAELIAFQNEVSLEMNREYLGRVVEVLVEGTAKRAGQMSGKTGTFKTIVFEGNASPNAFVKVLVSDCTQKTLIGEVV